MIIFELFLWSLPLYAIIYIIIVYNNIVRLEQRVLSARGDLSSMVERRNSIVAEITNQIKDGSEFEGTLQTSVAAIRESNDISNRHNTKASVSTDADRFKLAVAENYPIITSTEQRKEFQAIIAQAEAIIQKRVEIYNARADQLNSYIQSFPPVIFAPLLFKRAYPYVEEVQFQAASRLKEPQLR